MNMKWSWAMRAIIAFEVWVLACLLAYGWYK